MECVKITDYPDRMSAIDSDIIHAAVNGLTACGIYSWRRQNWIKLFLQGGRCPEITCRNCQHVLMTDDKKVSRKRFILRDPSHDLYFKSRPFPGDWTDDLYAATRWQTKAGANEALLGVMLVRFRAKNKKRPVQWQEFLSGHRSDIVICPIRLNLGII